ncbi:MAG: hypothetical protein AB4060_15510, partial [Crocosphaera sp.]
NIPLENHSCDKTTTGWVITRSKNGKDAVKRIVNPCLQHFSITLAVICTSIILIFINNTINLGFKYKQVLIITIIMVILINIIFFCLREVVFLEESEFLFELLNKKINQSLFILPITGDNHKKAIAISNFMFVFIIMLICLFTGIIIPKMTGSAPSNSNK